MTQPNGTYEWLLALRDVLGAQESDTSGADVMNVDSSRITNGPWIVMDGWFAVQWENNFGFSPDHPWDHWMPQQEPGWNAITLYREIRVTGGISRNYFQLVRGYVWFYYGTEENKSQAELSQELVSVSDQVISDIHQNPWLDADSLNRASDLFFNVSWWLMNQGRPALDGVVNDIDAGSDFDGSAADALSWALREMSFGMLALKENITDPADWIAALEQGADDIQDFKQAMINAWDTFKQANQYYDANWLVRDILESMERQVDTDRSVISVRYNRDLANAIAWDFFFPEQGLPGPYNLMDNAGWEGLNNDMVDAWRRHLDDLNRASQAATQQLVESFNAMSQALRRAVLPLPHIPPPGSGGPDGGPGTDDIDLSDILGGNGGGPGGGLSGGGSGLSDNFSIDGGLGDGAGGGGPSGGGGEFGVNGPEFTSGLGDGARSGVPAVGGEFGVNVPEFSSGLGSGSSLSGAAGTGALGGPVFSSGVGGAVGGPSRFAGDDSRRGGAGFNRALPDGDAGDISGPSPVRFSSGFVGPNGGTDGTGLGGLLGERGGSGLGMGGADGYSSSGRNGGFTLGPLGTPPADYTQLPLPLPDQSSLAGGVLSAGGPALEGLTDGLSPQDGTQAGSGAVMGGAPGGMPFMPPIGGMGGMGSPGRDNERERERSTWLTENSEVWGTDPECAPAVVGRETLPDTEPTQAPARHGGPSRRRAGDTRTTPARGT